jgi:hypothetical protein
VVVVVVVVVVTTMLESHRRNKPPAATIAVSSCCPLLRPASILTFLLCLQELERVFKLRKRGDVLSPPHRPLLFTAAKASHLQVQHSSYNQPSPRRPHQRHIRPSGNVQDMDMGKKLISPKAPRAHELLVRGGQCNCGRHHGAYRRRCCTKDSMGSYLPRL